MTAKELKRLTNNLEIEEDGEEIARLINRFLTRDQTDLLKLYLAQADEQTVRSEQEEPLSTQQETALRIIKDHGEPVSSSDLAELAEEDYSDLTEDTRSLRHRSHASAVLNDLVERGALGKMKYNNTIYYVKPEEAVRQWLKDHGDPDTFPIGELADDTGLPLHTVQTILEEI